MPCRRSQIAVLLLSGLALTGTSVATATPPAAQPVAARSVDPRAAAIAEAALRFGLPEHWIVAVLNAESAGNPRAVSRAGAMGLMQIMPATWGDLRIAHRLGADPFDPRDNILAGAAYLRAMYDRYGTVEAMLAAYNAGPARTDRHLATGHPLPAETRRYVALLAPILRGDGAVPGAPAAPPPPSDWRDAPLFVARSNNDPTDAVPAVDRADVSHSDPLFVATNDDGGSE